MVNEAKIIYAEERFRRENQEHREECRERRCSRPLIFWTPDDWIRAIRAFWEL